MALDVHVVTPDKQVWSGSAEMVIARGVDGAVGILAGHAPLLIRLAIGPLRIQREGMDDLRAVVDGGFMHVTSGDQETRVDVMATQAELADEIDRAAAERAKTEAEAVLQRRDSALGEAELEATRVAFRRATARIELTEGR